MGEIIEKAWGWEEVIVNTPKYCLKFLNIHKDHQCSYHRHLIKDETFYCALGSVRVQMEGFSQILERGHILRIPPQAWHRFIGLDDINTLIEISTHHDDADVERAMSRGASGPI